MHRFLPAHPLSAPMRILFDHSVPAPLRRYLTEHAVTEAMERAWDRLSNGDLLTEAERAIRLALPKSHEITLTVHAAISRCASRWCTPRSRWWRRQNELRCVTTQK